MPSFFNAPVREPDMMAAFRAGKSGNWPRQRAVCRREEFGAATVDIVAGGDVAAGSAIANSHRTAAGICAAATAQRPNRVECAI
jgi:hypothetical protein